MRTLQTIPENLQRAIADGGGMISRAHCLEVGVSRTTLHTLLRNGALTKLANGVYTGRKQHESLSPWDRFTLATRAFLSTAPDNCAAAGWSAVALHELPRPLKPPTIPSVFHQGSRRHGSRRTPFGHTRFAAIEDRWITQVCDTRCLDPAFAAVDLARFVPAPWSLIVADAAARLTSPGRLRQAAAAMELWPLIGRAEFAVQNVDPDSESALESAGRCAFLLGGLDIPQSNVWLGFERPMLRVDHYWASAGLVVEADGMGKYAIGGDPMASLRTEKDREHLLRTWALRLLRYGWRRAMYEQDVLVEQVRTALLEPPIGPIPGLRTWPAAEGYRILGMPYPRRRPAA